MLFVCDNFPRFRLTAQRWKPCGHTGLSIGLWGRHLWNVYIYICISSSSINRICLVIKFSRSHFLPHSSYTSSSNVFGLSKNANFLIKLAYLPRVMLNKNNKTSKAIYYYINRIIFRASRWLGNKCLSFFSVLVRFLSSFLFVRFLPLAWALLSVGSFYVNTYLYNFFCCCCCCSEFKMTMCIYMYWLRRWFFNIKKWLHFSVSSYCFIEWGIKTKKKEKCAGINFDVAVFHLCFICFCRYNQFSKRRRL